MSNDIPTVERPMTAKEAKATAKGAKAQAKALRPWYRRPMVLLGGLVALIVAIVVLSNLGGGDSSESASDTSGTSDTSGAEQDATAPAAGVGDAVRDGKFEFTVTDVVTGADNVGGEYGEDAQGSFTVVTMTVENIGDQPQMFSDSELKGFDTQGRELSADSAAGIYANEDSGAFFEEINPGNSLKAKVVFDLPEGETLSSLELHDSLASGGVAVEL